jgi:hypothetical protein
MIRFLQVRPLSHSSQRSRRLLLLGCALIGWGTALLWNPITQPGPVCCLLRRSVGLPCPMCGMTRGVALCVRGRVFEATWYNPLAGPLCLLALTLCLKWMFEVASKQSVTVVLRPAWNTGLWALLYSAVLVSWVYLLIYRREDDFASTWLGQMLHLFQ